jgi:hypothetical protein
MDSSTWTPHTSGSDGNFQTSGQSGENSRVLEEGPYGDLVTCWYGRSEDTDDNADGGWDWVGLDAVDVDPAKTYRYSVWVKQEYNSGEVFHGTQRVSDFSGNNQNNPYYKRGGTLPSLDDWYLVVGYNYPESATDGNESAVYNTDGEKVEDLIDFRWDLDGSNRNFTFHSYYYYDTNVGHGALFYDPRLEIIEDDYTTISELTNPANDWSNDRERYWYSGFERENFNKWDVNESSIVSDRVKTGGHSAYTTNPIIDDYRFRAEPFDGGQPISRFGYFYQETNNSNGGGVRLKNSNGNYECGFATDNPQWDVDDASGVNQVRSLKAYEQWVRCTMTFDWNAETFDIGLESANTTFTDSGRPMKNGIDVQYVEAWNYTGGNWGSGVDHEQWWDDFEVRL